MRAALFSLVVALVPVAVVGCDKGPQKTDTSASAPVTPTAAPAAASAPGAPGASSRGGQTFGAGVSVTTATPIDEILADPKKFNGQTVRVEGMITDVCPKRGCWFELAGDKPGQKLKFKVTDGEMVFPMDAKGQRVTAEGVVAVKEMSIEESKQYAEYQAKEYGKPYDPASITTPTVIARIDGTGAVIHDRP